MSEQYIVQSLEYVAGYFVFPEGIILLVLWNRGGAMEFAPFLQLQEWQLRLAQILVKFLLVHMSQLPL